MERRAAGSQILSFRHRLVRVCGIWFCIECSECPRTLQERMRQYWMLAGVWAIIIVGEFSYFMFGMLRPGSLSVMPAVVTGLCLALVYEGGKERLW